MSPIVGAILEEPLGEPEPVTIKTARPGLEITGRVRRPPPKIRVNINKLLRPVGIKVPIVAPAPPGVIDINKMLRAVG